MRSAPAEAELATAPPIVVAGLSAPGAPLPPPTRGYFESRLRADLGGVRLHDDYAAHRAARQLGAAAFAFGNRIGLGAGAPADGAAGRELLAHEIAHTLQPDSGQVVRRQPAASVGTTIDIEVIGQLTSYRDPATGYSYNVGDAAGPSILMQIEAMPNGRTMFRWYNFAAAETGEGSAADWDMRTFVSGMFPMAGFTSLGHQLSAADWRRLWPNPMPALLAMHEANTITLPDQVILTGYQGMIFQEGLKSLSENEQQVNQLLDAPDRVQRLQEYATSLREASMVRDALVSHLEQVRHSRVQAHSFTFGIAGNLINTDPLRQIQLAREEGEAEGLLQFWLSSFPLLSRFVTADIRATRVEEELRSIRASIASTRQELLRAQVGRGAFDLMELDVVRSRLQSQLGPRASAAIEADDRSRGRWAMAAGVGLFALSIGLLFLPGGVFIDAAIGIAMAATAVDRAIALGRAANTGLSIDDGLASQSQANAAAFGAVLAVAGAALGGAAAGFRIFRFASALRSVRAATSGVELGSQVRLARALVSHPELSGALRSTGELQEMAQRLGLNLTPAELQSLRQTVYHIQGVAALGSRQRLSQFLDIVWRERDNIRNGSTTVYRLYSRTTTNAALTRSQAAYLADLSSIASGRPAAAVSHIQGASQMIPGNQISTLVGQAARNPNVLQQIRGAFYMFFRAGAVRNGVVLDAAERVYLNIVADRATDVMRRVVQEIVDRPQEFPGVIGAKLTGPAGVVRRADAIVIYMQDQAASGRVLDWVRTYQRINPADFQEAIPQMTEGVSTGVAVGAEPVGSGGRVSFGGLRSDLIQHAVDESFRRGLTREQFGARVDDLFRQAHIDPDLPHGNLP